MIKILKIIMFIPIVNLLSFHLLAIPIPLIYKFKKKVYFNSFIKMLIGFIFYAVILSIFKFGNDVIDLILRMFVLYLLGIYFTFVSLKSIGIAQQEKR